MKYKERN